METILSSFFSCFCLAAVAGTAGDVGMDEDGFNRIPL